MKTDNFRELRREYEISPRVGCKWKARFEAEGLAGMGDGSWRTKSTPEGLKEEVVCRIVRLKERHRHWGARKLLMLYERQWGAAPSESSIKRVPQKAGLVEERRRRPAREGGRLCSGRQAEVPNAVWTVDCKGWWRDAQGCCEPLTVRDEFSRMVLENRALGDATTGSARAAFERLLARHGLPGAIRSDNGAHERLIAREVQGTAYEGRQATLDEWTRTFNEERPHEALGMKTPAKVYVKSTRPWKGTPEELEDEGTGKRKVCAQGSIRYEGRIHFLSTALAGWDVGLKAGAKSKVDVDFGRLLPVQIEPESASFQAIKAEGKASRRR